MPSAETLLAPRLLSSGRFIVVNTCFGLITCAPPGLMKSPAQVEILGVHPLARVEPTHLIPGGPANQQKCANCPRNLAAEAWVESLIEAPALGEPAAQTMQS